ncbi:unnamed protein product [Amoebophrya sp. A120]|nr:unnamed protein product [Amoebophrya sp. A120]|eukprot:GSA120T00023535001.1
MALNPLVLEITQGIAEFSNRVGLKTLMSQYGEVDVCWIPPYMDRDKDVAYVKFKSSESAELAMKAMTQGLVMMHGVQLQGRYRMGMPPKTDSKGDGNVRVGTDDAKSSYGAGRFTDSRALMASLRDNGRRGGRDRERDRDHSRSRRARRRSHRRSRSRRDSRRRSRSRSRSKSRNRDRERSRREEKTSGAGSPAEAIGEEEDGCVVVHNFLGPKQSLGLKLSNDKRVVEFEHPDAAFFGWRIGDQIVDVNGTDAADIKELVKIMGEVKKSGVLPLSFRIRRPLNAVSAKALGSEYSRMNSSKDSSNREERSGGSANQNKQHQAIEGVNAVRDLISRR